MVVDSPSFKSGMIAPLRGKVVAGLALFAEVV
jgi:hypothetical protein